MFRVAQYASGELSGGTAEPAAQCALLRDIFGNPFHRPPAIEPAWLSWNEGRIIKLARAIYNQRDFGRLSDLRDTLKEAGCTDTELLAHSQVPGTHVRGCWLVDLLLGKES